MPVHMLTHFVCTQIHEQVLTCTHNTTAYDPFSISPSSVGSTFNWLPDNSNVLSDFSPPTAHGKRVRRLFRRSKYLRDFKRARRCSGISTREFPSKYRHYRTPGSVCHHRQAALQTHPSIQLLMHCTSMFPSSSQDEGKSLSCLLLRSRTREFRATEHEM